MKIEKPTKDELEFYSQFPTFRIVNKGKYFEYLEVQTKYIVCKVNLSELQSKYIKYSERSVEKGCEIQIPYSEFVKLLNEPCRYCGQKSDTIDRINSSGCYSIDNIQALCKKCNFMKYTYTEDEFKNHICLIYKHLFE